MYIADSARYEKMEYRKSGHSGLKLPILSLGLWQNFGDYDPIHNQREILRGAFDMGITHFVHTENGALVNLSFQVVIRVSKEWG